MSRQRGFWGLDLFLIIYRNHKANNMRGGGIKAIGNHKATHEGNKEYPIKTIQKTTYRYILMSTPFIDFQLLLLSNR